MRGRIRGVFHAPGGRLFFAPGTKGGVFHKKAWGVPTPHSFKSFVFYGLPLLFGFHNDDTEKSGETIATPPEKGGSYRPRVAALWDRPLHRPQGVAIVGIYPCGKARKRRPGGGLTRREADLGLRLARRVDQHPGPVS